MDIKIKYSSKGPIYLQIKNQIRDAILNDEIEKDKALPSIRLLAKELRVSVATTKRAYDELEKDGLINRKVYPVVPPKTEYSLTKFGETLTPILDELCNWGEQYLIQK